MANIKLNLTGLKITTPVLNIQREIKNAIYQKYQESTGLRKRLDDAAFKIANFFYRKFIESDTFTSLVYGELRAEFGFSDEYLNDIETVIANMITVELDSERTNKTNFIKITFGVIDNESLDLSEGSYYSKGGLVPWLKWLLMDGTSELVAGYNVFIKEGIGRSHMAVMIPDNYVSYSVDPQYAGTEEDNWITRTLKANKQEFLKMIKDAMNGP